LQSNLDLNQSLKVHHLTTEEVQASVASNIALIKYMGKIEGSGNRPTNASLSYTMDHLRTSISLKQSKDQDHWMFWQEHADAKKFNLNLSTKGQEKFLQFLSRLKSEFKIEENFLVKSVNNFPSDAGLASSASSFAALTWASYLWSIRNRINRSDDLQASDNLKKYDFEINAEELSKLSKISRQGSGSSCRSFYSPWGLWKEEGAEFISLPQKKLHHFVLLIEKNKKEVSSSEAHRLVAGSPLFAKDDTGLDRPTRAQRRLDELVNCLQTNQWKKSYQICWDEFIDMHELFHTSQPSFRYMNDHSESALKHAKNLWNQDGMGPLVTMDAGPNVHFLFREEDFDLAKSWKNFYLNQKFEVLDSWTLT